MNVLIEATVETATNQARNQLAYCFVSSPCYLPQVFTCVQSMRRTGDDTQVFIDVLGVVDNLDTYFSDARVSFIPHDRIKKDDEARRRGYMGVEFACAAKSVFLAYIRDNYDFDYLVYLDSDLFFVRSLADYLAVNTFFGLVLLAPHNTSSGWASDLSNSRSGVFNAGIIGIPANHPFLPWWEEKCRECCVLEPEDGLFVDQKWLDQVPAMFDDVRVCRDPSINIGYWNITQRQKHLHNAVFYHFSGVPLSDSEKLSIYSDLSVPNGVIRLVSLYRTELLSAMSAFEERCVVSLDYSSAPNNLLAARLVDGATSGWLERRKPSRLGRILFCLCKIVGLVVPDHFLTLIVAFFRRLGRHSTWYAER